MGLGSGWRDNEGLSGPQPAWIDLGIGAGQGLECHAVAPGNGCQRLVRFYGVGAGGEGGGAFEVGGIGS